MWRFNLTIQVFVLLVLPALAGLGAFLEAPAEFQQQHWGIALCLVLELAGIAVFAASTITRLRIAIDNGYRWVNALPERQLPPGNDEISRLADVLKKVYVQLDSTSNKYRACLANSGDVICTVGADYLILMDSDASSRLWGYDPLYMVGRYVADFVPPEDYESFLQASRRTTESSSPVEVELRLKKRDGMLCWTLWSMTWVAKESAYFCVVKDITQQKQIEQMKREFINTVSHDLRTPLLSIGAFLEVLSVGKYGALNETGQSMTSGTQASVTRLIRLVNDLLDLEKMEEGKFELDICELPVSEIINDAVSSIDAYAQKRAISITRSGDLDSEVLADPQRLVQVVQNLLSNAVKFSPSHSTIEVSARAEEKTLQIRIVDQGPGIPQDQLEYIFDRFRQLPQSEGTGLGLAICRAIVSQHHGSMGVTSKEGAGSTFWVRVPLSPAQMSATAAGTGAADAGSAEASSAEASSADASSADASSDEAVSDG